MKHELIYNTYIDGVTTELLELYLEKGRDISVFETNGIINKMRPEIDRGILKEELDIMLRHPELDFTKMYKHRYERTDNPMDYWIETTTGNMKRLIGYYQELQVETKHAAQITMDMDHVYASIKKLVHDHGYQWEDFLYDELNLNYDTYVEICGFVADMATIDKTQDSKTLFQKMCQHVPSRDTRTTIQMLYQWYHVCMGNEPIIVEGTSYNMRSALLAYKINKDGQTIDSFIQGIQQKLSQHDPELVMDIYLDTVFYMTSRHSEFVWQQNVQDLSNITYQIIASQILETQNSAHKTKNIDLRVKQYITYYSSLKNLDNMENQPNSIQQI